MNVCPALFIDKVIPGDAMGFGHRGGEGSREGTEMENRVREGRHIGFCYARVKLVRFMTVCVCAVLNTSLHKRFSYRQNRSALAPHKIYALLTFYCAKVCTLTQQSSVR